MATSNPTTQPSAQLCDYCHQKPKFSNHHYCSKTCAGQAAALCNQCHKKPKYQNFEYCGKNCAALANAQQPRKPAPLAAQPQPAGVSKGLSYPKGNTFNTQKPSNPAINPVQLAKLVAQQMPQVQALLASSANPAPSAPVAPIIQPVGPAVQPAPVPKSKNPFANLLNKGPTSAAVNGVLAAPPDPLLATQQLHVSAQAATASAECLIPGCGKPVHVDAKGSRTSDYCSKRHREEAVESGLVSPCIMCLALPQSEMDYFCGRACRDDAMSKALDE